MEFIRQGRYTPLKELLDVNDRELDAVLLDMTTDGDMQGEDVCRLCQEVGTITPLIACTGATMQEHEFTEMGCVGFLMKPFVKEDMYKVLKKIRHRKQRTLRKPPLPVGTLSPLPPTMANEL